MLFQNDLTGEYSCVMLKTLVQDLDLEMESIQPAEWLQNYWGGACVRLSLRDCRYERGVVCLSQGLNLIPFDINGERTTA